MWMPKRNPLSMPTQDFSVAFEDSAATSPKTPARIWVHRTAVLGPAVLATFMLVFWLGSLLGADGFSPLEAVWVSLIFSTFLWVSITFASACAGVVSAFSTKRKAEPTDVEALNVAVLSPIHNESPSHVFGNVAAMVEQLRKHSSHHSYSFFLLSDTQDVNIAALEENAMLHMRANMQLDFPIYFRRRALNTDRKTGNLSQWLQNWGGAYDAMLIFDADSIMSAAGIQALTDELATDPSVALVQSCPRLIGSETLFGRMQQFSSAAFGLFPALGEAFWSHREANYHGHNAIMRTGAFATCAGLPHLKDRGGKETLIFSHDFVEASLLRRAGWGVRMVPNLEPTYEETPTTLIDYVLRDRRWCHGNMQHLRVMWSSGLHPVSRFHLGQNALTYLMSPLWFALVLIGSMFGTTSNDGVLSLLIGQPASDFINFSVFQANGLWLLAAVYLMLIAPKIAGAASVVSNITAVSSFKGRITFLLGVAAELLGSMSVAPILMVQQTKAISGTVIGRREEWGPQKRYGAHYNLFTMLRFHAVETIIGLVLLFGIVSGVVSLWLVPITVSLVGATLLSFVSGLGIRKEQTNLFATPHETDVPPILKLAQKHQFLIAESGTYPAELQLAAE